MTNGNSVVVAAFDVAFSIRLFGLRCHIFRTFKN